MTKSIEANKANAVDVPELVVQLILFSIFMVGLGSAIWHGNVGHFLCGLLFSVGPFIVIFRNK